MNNNGEIENDEMMMVETDFEIIKNLSNKVDLLDNNLDKLIYNNNIFIEKMININTSKDLNIETNNNKNEIENNIDLIKNKLNNMKLEELKNICKKNDIKKYYIYNKSDLINYIINQIDIDKLFI